MLYSAAWPRAATVEKFGQLQVRTYGASGPVLIVLHGGPAAAGEAAPLARGLADSFRALEPWQRGSDGEPLTVARHVDDLHEIVTSRCCGTPPAIVGESWGAMLALAYAAGHPESAGPLVLIGCGTFDPASRARMQAILDDRMEGGLRQHIDALEDEFLDPAARLIQRYRLTESLYSYDSTPSEEDPEVPPFDMAAHTETWNNMLRLQAAGVYPAAFAAIRSPVIMLHGAYDPHPGQMIRASLAPYIPQLEYREWQRCGHSPWRERAVREEFFAVLREWLSGHL
jgi:pimeloyl-ACP methyl ester carboxylesterase